VGLARWVLVISIRHDPTSWKERKHIMTSVGREQQPFRRPIAWFPRRVLPSDGAPDAV